MPDVHKITKTIKMLIKQPNYQIVLDTRHNFVDTATKTLQGYKQRNPYINMSFFVIERGLGSKLHSRVVKKKASF